MRERETATSRKTEQLDQERTLLARFAPVARAEILRAYSPDSCIVSTAIGIEVLGRFGLRAAPLSVDAMVLNRAFVERLEQRGSFPSSEQEQQRWAEAGCYAVQIDTRDPRRPAGWPGHLVAVVERRWLVDLSLDQFTRPEHGIELFPLYERVTERFLRGREDLAIETNEGVRIIHRARPWDRRFEGTPDWQPPDDARRGAWQDTVRRIIERMGSGESVEADHL